MTACTSVACRPANKREDLGVKRVSYFRPTVDVIEDPAEFRIIADVPGVAAENIEIEFERGALVLTARILPRTASKPAPIVEEYGVGDFRRVFKLSETIDPERVVAEYTEGVLTIRLPKTETARRRKIDVKIA
jgi:HSP20 family protein